MRTQHTPGPWSRFTLYSYIEIRGRDGKLVALVGSTSGSSVPARDRADARLIAAAPDLLEALEMVRDADNDAKRDGLPSIPNLPRARIDAAIALVNADAQLKDKP